MVRKLDAPGRCCSSQSRDEFGLPPLSAQALLAAQYPELFDRLVAGCELKRVSATLRLRHSQCCINGGIQRRGSWWYGVWRPFTASTSGQSCSSGVVVELTSLTVGTTCSYRSSVAL
jgi:hypothetical protein